MSRRRLSRRQFVAATALSSAALISAPYLRTARAAGKLAIGFWDHWVPGANKTSTDVMNEWAAKEKVEVQIDYITSQGNKLLLTQTAEAQAKSGHDILRMPTLVAACAFATMLEPINDVMEPIDQAERRCQWHGEISRPSSTASGSPFLPACGSQIKGPCSRIDLMKKYANIDVQEMYPAGSPPKAENWTMDTFLKAAEACQKGGYPFGIGLGETSEFRRYGRCDLPVVWCRTRQRQGRPDRQDRRGAASTRILQEADPDSCRPTWPPGTTPRTTNG